MRLLPALLPLSLLAGSVLAQEVTLRGKVEDVQGTQNSFFLDCTDTALTSSAFNLNAFIGQTVELTGSWNGSAANPAVNITALTPVAENYEIGGGAKIGETSTQGFTAAPGTVALGLLSLGSSFLPLPGSGVILIDASQVVLTASGTVGGTGILELPFFIPNNPNLIGLDFFGQGALIAGGSILLTNPDCKTIDN